MTDAWPSGLLGDGLQRWAVLLGRNVLENPSGVGSSKEGVRRE